MVTTMVPERFGLRGSDYRSSGGNWAGHLWLPLGSDVLAGSPDSSAVGRQAARNPLGLLKLDRAGVREGTLYVPKPAEWPFREVFTEA